MATPDLIALRAMFGQEEANHGTRRYRVDSGGLVRVPAEAAFCLINNGGFAVASTTVAQVPRGSFPVPPLENARSAADPCSLVRLHHDGAGGCSHDGRKFQSDENGDVLVPVEAVVDLLTHGFIPVMLDPHSGEPELGRQPIGVESSPVGGATLMAAPSGEGLNGG